MKNSKKAPCSCFTCLRDTAINSFSVTLYAVILAPFFFFFSRNAFAYSWGQIGVSLGVVTAAASGLVLLVHVASRKIPLLQNMNMRLLRIYNALRGGGAVSVFFALSHVSLSENFPYMGIWRLDLVFIACVFLLITALSYRFGLRPINAFFVPFLLITFAGFVSSLSQVGSGEQVARRENHEIRFTTRPNIYFFFLESYGGSKALYQLYGIDSAGFYQQLEKRGFLVRDTYANRDYTIASCATVFLMKHYNIKNWQAGVLDAKSNIFNMINGTHYNPVLDVLKKNGYRISYIHMANDLYRQPSPAVHFTNISFGLWHYIKPLYQYTNSKPVFPVFQRQSLANRFFDDCRRIIRRALDTPAEPTFHFIYTGLDHTQAELQLKPTAQDRESYRQSFIQLYKKSRDDFNPKLLALLDYIAEQDPNGVIIMIGDHGTWFHRLFDKTDPGAGFFNNMENLAEDVFSVIFAVKTPLQQRLWQERDITHVNLFRYVFSMLADDSSLLNALESDVSIYLDGKYIFNHGRLLGKKELLRVYNCLFSDRSKNQGRPADCTQ